MLHQIFPIIYKGKCYMVDPSYLCCSSNKFKKILEHYINQNINMESLRLLINYEEFSPRNIDNFFKICQDLQTDVQNSEMLEICEIALMFQAEKIYDTSLAFIHENIDSNFSVSPSKFQNNQLFKIESIDVASFHHITNLNDLKFDDSYEYTQTEDTSNNPRNNNGIKRDQPVIYQIKVENSLLKCCRFLFISGDKLLFTAKQKIHQIFIGEGKEIHIDDKKVKKAAIITQSNDGYNIVNTDEQDIKIFYTRNHPNKLRKYFSLRLSFIHGGSLVSWSPKPLEKSEKIKGFYDHQPIQSKKNILLQNKARHTTFIVRKMAKNLYETECHSTISPVIVFSIALSQIVGPFCV